MRYSVHCSPKSGDTAEHMMLIGLGEPFMDPKIFERIEYCHQHSVSTLLSTNGTFLDERYATKVLDSPLEQITLSFDGFKKETFEFYRKGAKFEKVRDNFVRFARMKHERGSKLQIVVQMVRMEGNAGEVDDFLGFWKGIPGVDELRIKEDETNLMRPDAGPCRRRLEISLPLPVARRGLRQTEWRRVPLLPELHAGRQAAGHHRAAAADRRSGTPNAMQEMRRLHAAGRGGEVDICARCCTTIPHPLLVTGSLLLHGKTVRRMLPVVERLTYLAKLPTRLLRPPKRTS